MLKMLYPNKKIKQKKTQGDEEDGLRTETVRVTLASFFGGAAVASFMGLYIENEQNYRSMHK